MCILITKKKSKSNNYKGDIEGLATQHLEGIENYKF
jgi:hypothetical protein